MAIIKAPPKQPKSVTIQARVEESVKTQLDQYAKFIESTPSHVITEALKVLFKRDEEFKAWLGQHAKEQNSETVQGEALTKTASQISNPIQLNSVCARIQRRQDGMPRDLQWIRCHRCPKLSREVCSINSQLQYWVPVQASRTSQSLAYRWKRPQDEKGEIVPKLFPLMQPL